MQTIGLLGGMSWESTAIYYRDANRLVRERFGGLHSAPIIMSSLDFADVAKLQAEDQWESAGALLGEHAARLESAGAKHILICTNTMHLVYEQVQSSVTVPILHIAEPVVAAAKGAGLTRVGLLGTAFTMEKRFLSNRLREQGIQCVTPTSEDREYVHNAIFQELMQGEFSDRTRNGIRNIIHDLVLRGAQAIVLACTELELLLSQTDSPVPLYPTAQMHITAAVNLASEATPPYIAPS